MKKRFAKEAITEESKIQDEWYKEAEKMTAEKLPAFIEKLTTKYVHDYGTIAHACSAALATAHVIDRSECGGITGFQAGFVWWGFVSRWLHIEGPAKLVTYEDMLYPQYEHKFEKVISKETHQWLMKEANKKLKEAKEKSYEVSPVILDHWKKIASGALPFGYTLESSRSE